jgi:small-conductance mechanosensitive channel/CRP-like cAMP-binding protein
MSEAPTPTPRRWSTRLKQLLLPLGLAVALGLLLYYGSNSYQLIGAAALDTTRRTLGYVLGVGLLASLTVFVQRAVQLVLLEGLVAPALGTPVPRLLSQLAALIVYLLGFAAIFGIVFKQDLTALWAASGIVGFVFGMALREMILDIFTGLAINIDRPIRIGDDILLHRMGDMTIEGRVREISWRTTRIEDLNGNLVVVANSKIGSSTITNYSQPQPSFRARVKVILDIGVPPERAERILLGAATQALAELAPGTVAAPVAWVHDIGPFGIEYLVEFETSLLQRQTARGAMVKAIMGHLSRAGLRPSVKEGKNPPPPSVVRETAPRLEQIALLLAGTPLFGGLEPADIELLARGAALRSVEGGVSLVQSGEVATVMLLILEGLVEADPLRREINAAAGDPRGAAPIRFGPGTLIGGEATLTGDGYPRTVRARTPVLLAQLDQPLFRSLLAAKPALARVLAERLADSLEQEERAANRGRSLMTGSGDRVADVLGSLCRTFADLRLTPGSGE